MNKSNSTIVKGLVRKEILNSLEGHTDALTLDGMVKEFNEQIKVNTYGNMSFQEAVNYTIKGCYGGFEFENYKIKEFIDSLEINNNSKKEFNEDQYFDMYCHLIGRELPYMLKMDNKQLEKILK